MPLSASFAVNRTMGYAPLEITATSSTTADATDPVQTHTWHFGDGSSETGSTATHTYANPGTYFVETTAATTRGATSTSAQIMIIVLSAEPAPIEVPDPEQEIIIIGTPTATTTALSGVFAGIYTNGVSQP